MSDLVPTKLEATLKSYMDAQEKTNSRVESQITELAKAIGDSNSNMNNAISSLADKIAEKGQISWQMIFGAISVLVGVVSMVGLLITSNTNQQLVPLTQSDKYMQQTIERNHEDVVHNTSRIEKLGELIHTQIEFTKEIDAAQSARLKGLEEKVNELKKGKP